MIYPWRTHDYPVTTRDISKKTRDFRGKPGNVQPVIYPWQTRDLPVTTRDFFTGSNVPQYIENFWGIYAWWQFAISILDIQKGNRFQNSDCESKQVWEGKPVFLEKKRFFPQNLVFRGEPRFY